MATTSVDPVDRFRAAVTSAASADLGGDLPVGTSVVPATSRTGSTTAVAYPMGEQTIIWCSHDLAPRLASLNGPTALDVDEFVSAAVALGGTASGRGRCRVLTDAPKVSGHDGDDLFDGYDGYDVVTLDRDDDADRRLLASFIDACPDDDLDEAELDMDELDPAIVVLVAPDGAIAAYASGREWWMDSAFDDIAVITHPDHRGRRLGAAVVAEFARRRTSMGRMMFYNCDVENLGSNRVAEAVGFELVVTVAAVAFA